jgi:hypothetical protein
LHEKRRHGWRFLWDHDEGGEGNEKANLEKKLSVKISLE